MGHARNLVLLACALMALLAPVRSARANGTRWGVGSDVGTLGAVLVDEPGDELERVTAANAKALLFDTPLDAPKAQRQHRAIQRVLRKNGAEVLNLRSMFAEVLADPAVRAQVIRETVAGLPASRRAAIASHLGGLAAPALQRALVVGVTRADLAPALRRAIPSSAAFALAPLPNSMFVRDLGIMLGDHMLLAHPAKAARVREALHARIVFEHHPRFRELATLSLGAKFPLEGGDVIAMSPDVLLVGTGHRTTFKTAVELARRLSLAGSPMKVVAFKLPSDNPDMFHADTVLTPLGDDLLDVHPVLHRLSARVITPGAVPGEVTIQRAPRLLPALARAVGLPAFRTVELAGAVADAEQKRDGQNVVAVTAGHVVAYAHNPKINRLMRRAGVRVEAVRGDELVRGRGGPHCLTLPIARAATARTR